jgi:hypothetical protein
MEILFKEWLPDLPALGNPGLTEAKNALPVNGTYKSFRETGISDGTVASNPVGAYVGFSTAGAELVVGTQTLLFKEFGDAFVTASATLATNTYWRFTQYDDIVIAVAESTVPLARTVGSSAEFTALAMSGTAPAAQQVGVVGQFVVVGDRSSAEPHSVQWSAIADPRNWPTPGSSTAIAAQAGEQVLRSEFGTVNAITNGDQFGLIFQDEGITRMTYVGGAVVFQFDEISEGIGCHYPNSVVQIGGFVYFASVHGFYRTNGVTVEPIGAGKVDRYFTANVASTFPERVYAGVDRTHNCIYWSYPTTLDSGVPTKLLIYNYLENRFSRAEVVANSIPQSHNVKRRSMEAFDADNVRITFGNTSLPSPAGAVLDATFVTGEAELNPGGFAHVSGVKAMLDGSSEYTVALGSRNDQSTAASFTSAVTANSRSGFSDFRSSARYHRARLIVTSTFNSAQGLQILASPDGAV